MDKFQCRYRGFDIFEIVYVEGETSGEFIVEGFGQDFLSLAAARRLIDETLAEIEPLGSFQP